MSEHAQVLISKENDIEMVEANKKAQETFKYFWREVYWECRRIIPALDFAAVKILFKDENVRNGDPTIEHMWINEVDFDGTFITGFLMNAPNWLRNISQGDFVKAKLADLSDWMFAIDGKSYGGFTVNLLRSRMDTAERREHDKSWQLDFGPPDKIDLVYCAQNKGFLSKWFGLNTQLEEQALIEHPMSVNMKQSLIDELKESDELLSTVDDLGCSSLHKEALAGNATSVGLLLEHGANRMSVNNKGETPLDLAKCLGWEHVIDLLS